MAKYTRGDVVKKDKGRLGVVRAVFVSKDGQQMYAVEKDGAFEFMDEARLSHIERPELAA